MNTKHPSCVYLVECSQEGKAWMPLDDVYERTLLAAKIAVNIEKQYGCKCWKYRVVRYRRGAVVR